MDEKFDSIQLEYTYLLTSQLESQRNYYEEKLSRLQEESKQGVSFHNETNVILALIFRAPIQKFSFFLFFGPPFLSPPPRPQKSCGKFFTLPRLAISFDSTSNACISRTKSWTRNNNIYLKSGNNSKSNLYHFTQNDHLLSQYRVANIQAIALSLYAVFR